MVPQIKTLKAGKPHNKFYSKRTFEWSSRDGLWLPNWEVVGGPSHSSCIDLEVF